VPLSADELLAEILGAQPSNEAEVETKILLPLFALLGYTFVDRADKVPIKMQFGREKFTKVADFVLYEGAERAHANALVAVEAKDVGESLQGAQEQVISYASWAGTPLYLVCNGTQVLASRFAPTSASAPHITIPLAKLPSSLEDLRGFVGRAEAIIVKERLGYLAEYVPNVEDMPKSQFFKEYLERLGARFFSFRYTSDALKAPSSEPVQPKLPVRVQIEGADGIADHIGLAELLANRARAFVEGAPGSGKSTLSRRVAGVLANRSLQDGTGLIPVFISLGRGVPPSILAAFERACNDLGVKTFRSIYEKALRASDVVLILDGLDELLESPGSDARLLGLLRNSGDTAVLVTSRPQGIKLGKSGVTRDRFNFGRIVPLSDLEVGDVLAKYLADPADAARIVTRYEQGLFPDITSPMLLLMCIRIANEMHDWMHLSLFGLYERYVGALNSFFNAQTVRGGDNVASDATVLQMLGDAAVEIRKAQWRRRPLSFVQLVKDLEAQHSHGGTRSFINTGLLISAGGKARFVHLTFEEFGLARAMLHALARGDEDDFIISGISDTTYQIAQSGMTLADESKLVAWLENPSRQVRKRAAGILKYGFSAATGDMIWKLIDQNKLTTSAMTLLGTLLSRGDRRAFHWLKEHQPKLSKRAISHISPYAPKELLPLLFRHAEELANGRPALTTVLRTGAIEFIPDLRRLYVRLRVSERQAFARTLAKYAQRPMAEMVLNEVILIEPMPSVALRHLGLLIYLGMPISEKLSEYLIALVRTEADYVGRDAKRAVNLAEHIRHGSITSDSLSTLAGELERVGRAARQSVHGAQMDGQ
jgi:hypothetical protein